MTDAVIHYPNHAFIRIRATDDALHDLDDHFTFMVAGAQHMPLYREKVWDGKIHLFKVNSGMLYRGLKDEAVEFLQQQGYTVDVGEDDTTPLSVAPDFITSLGMPYKPRDYQADAFMRAMANPRAVILSPTASGKSLIIYMIAKRIIAAGQRVLVIVPTVNLVNQMTKDFEDYANGQPLSVHKIMAGKDRNAMADIVVTTWQSIVKQPSSWYANFGAVIGDEVHQYKAKSLTTIMEAATNVPYRIGLTGTLDDIKENELTIRGLFGNIFRTKTTSELIERGDVSPVKIHMCTIKYDGPTKKAFWSKHTDDAGRARRPRYDEEIEMLVGHDGRLAFVSKLARALKGTTLVLFRYKKEHGLKLYELLKKSRDDVYYVSGDVVGEKREEVRQYVMNNPGCIVIASMGTFSTGVNIPNIDNIVLAHPLKTKITLLQSIGRGLRLSKGKTMCNVYDIVDDFVASTTKVNYVFGHARDRLKLYIREDFPISHHTYLF